MLAVLNLGGGGVIATDVILSDATDNITVVNLDGGTLQATASRGDFMQGLTNVFIRSGGVTIDTPYAITIVQDLLDGGGEGGLTKTGTGTLQLDGANTYTGTTTVNSGGFGGDGTIAGPVVINSEGTLRPGGGAIGTLTINNNLTLNPGADAVFELNTANSPGTNDLLVVSGTLSIADSSLTVINDGPALVAGDSFKLFSQAVASGSFTNVVLPGGYVWNNKLAVDGSIEVVSVLPPPSFPPGAVTTLPDGNISLTATGAVGAIYSLRASPDVAVPVASWTLLTNGTITVSPFTINDLEATNYPQRFYLFSTP
jgi:autotransporter-associated beta strand protein